MIANSARQRRKLQELGVIGIGTTMVALSIDSGTPKTAGNFANPKRVNIASNEENAKMKQ